MEAKNSNNIRKLIIVQVFAILFLLVFFSVKAFSRETNGFVHESNAMDPSRELQK